MPIFVKENNKVSKRALGGAFSRHAPSHGLARPAVQPPQWMKSDMSTAFLRCPRFPRFGGGGLRGRGDSYIATTSAKPSSGSHSCTVRAIAAHKVTSCTPRERGRVRRRSHPHGLDDRFAPFLLRVRSFGKQQAMGSCAGRASRYLPPPAPRRQRALAEAANTSSENNGAERAQRRTAGTRTLQCIHPRTVARTSAEAVALSSAPTAIDTGPRRLCHSQHSVSARSLLGRCVPGLSR
jgi:hypothetical protein